MSDDPSHRRQAPRLSATSSDGQAFECGESRSEVVGVVGFDFDAVFGELDGEHPSFNEEVRAGVVDAFGSLLRHLLFDTDGGIRDARSIGRQLIMTCYSTEMVNGLTLSEIGNGEGISKQSLTKRLREARERLGLTSHVQPREATRANYTAAHLGEKHWRRRREAEANRAERARQGVGGKET